MLAWQATQFRIWQCSTYESGFYSIDKAGMKGHSVSSETCHHLGQNVGDLDITFLENNVEFSDVLFMQS